MCRLLVPLSVCGSAVEFVSIVQLSVSVVKVTDLEQRRLARELEKQERKNRRKKLNVNAKGKTNVRVFL